MTQIIVELKVTVASEFGEKVSELLVTQRGTEGNPLFFGRAAALLADKCNASTQTMLGAEFGRPPS